MGVALNGSHYWDPNLWTSITAWVTKLKNDFSAHRSDGTARIRRCFTDVENGGLQIWTIMDENDFTSRLDETNAT